MSINREHRSTIHGNDIRVYYGLIIRCQHRFIRQSDIPCFQRRLIFTFSCKRLLITSCRTVMPCYIQFSSINSNLPRNIHRTVIHRHIAIGISECPFITIVGSASFNSQITIDIQLRIIDFSTSVLIKGSLLHFHRTVFCCKGRFLCIAYIFSFFPLYRKLICLDRRTIHCQSRYLIQLIDRIAVFLFCLRGIRSPISDNDFSALHNTGSRLFQCRICCRRILRHIQYGTICNVELPFVLHQYIFHVGATAINSDRSDRQSFFYRTFIILFFRVRKCISRIQPISRCITILQRDSSIICPSASSYSFRTIDFRFTSIIYIKCILSAIDTATIYNKSAPIIYRNFTIFFAAINEIDLISGQLGAVL